MSIYATLALLSATAVYIVDLSGFTESWRGLLARMLGIPANVLRDLPPFDCGKCSSFWLTIIWALISGEMSVTMFAYCSLLAYLAPVTERTLRLVRGALLSLIDKLNELI